MRRHPENDMFSKPIPTVRDYQSRRCLLRNAASRYQMGRAAPTPDLSRDGQETKMPEAAGSPRLLKRSGLHEI